MITNAHTQLRDIPLGVEVMLPLQTHNLLLMIYTCVPLNRFDSLMYDMYMVSCGKDEYTQVFLVLLCPA